MWSNNINIYCSQLGIWSLVYGHIFNTPTNHGCPTFLWQRAIFVIVGGFADHMWKIMISGTPNHLSYTVIFMAYT